MVKCFDVVNDVIRIETDNLNGEYEPDAERVDILKEYCEIIDDLLKEFDGISIEVDVDETTLWINIALEVGDILISKREHEFYELVKRSVTVDFYRDKKSKNLVCRFVFPSVWVEKY